MASVNKVILVGNIGRDPEVKYSNSGAAVCNVSLATTRRWKSKTTDEAMEETEWSRVVFYDRLAEIAGEYLKKGRSVYVEGRLKTRKWQDKDGAERYTTEIVADNMQMLGGRDDAERPAERTERTERSPARTSAPRTSAVSASGFDDMDDDIPF